MTNLYHTTRNRNDDEGQIAIRAPDGRAIAFIEFWSWEDIDGAQTEAAIQAEGDAKLIVDALNAYKSAEQVAASTNAA